MPASEASELMAKGKLTAVALTESCLARIEARDKDIEAWAFVDSGLALAQARARDREPRRSPLHGIPVGVKDIIDTMDMPTEYGSPIYEDHRPQWDAACVSMWRAAGGIILGKTVTVEFAMRHPSRTRNPNNPLHTPGGSSSGSAAAVADCMAPLALGTQTGGSVIRPCAFCGVVGYKPTFGTINRAGVKPLAESLDTVGMMARSVGDVALAYAVLTRSEIPDLGAIAAGDGRVGFCRTPHWHRLDAASATALDALASRLARGGAAVEEARMPEGFERVWEAHDRINDYESCRALGYERGRFPELLSPTLSERLAKAERCTLEGYLSARAFIAQWQAKLRDLFSDYDVLLTPSAPGEAPEGLATTGDAVFNRPWTALHVPAVTVPIGRGARGLPLGAQVIAPFGMDALALGFGDRIHKLGAG